MGEAEEILCDINITRRAVLKEIYNKSPALNDIYIFFTACSEENKGRIFLTSEQHF